MSRSVKQAYEKLDGFDRSYSGLRQDSVFGAAPRPAHLRLTPTVETVEKVPFQKLTFEKWDRNIKKRLVFYVSNNILAIFEPVVGVFCEDFSHKGFFDSLVRRFAKFEKVVLVSTK